MRLDIIEHLNEAVVLNEALEGYNWWSKLY
jgi:hypothetical protein